MNTNRKKQNKPRKTNPGVLVVSHDAGASEILAAYVEKHRTRHAFLCYINGPAVKIFKRQKIPYRLVSDVKKEIAEILGKHSSVNSVLTGTGWMTDIECKFIREAKKRSIRTASFLDSWVGYRERFGYPREGWKKNLSDEIWVGDQYARRMAEKYFSKEKVKIKYISNPYFADVKAKFASIKKKNPHPNALLLISHAKEQDPKAFFDKLLKLLAGKNFRHEIIIRLHPAESSHKYDTLLSKYGKTLHMEKSKQKDLLEDIVRSNLVVGAESMALVIAALCSKKAISIAVKKNQFLPPFPNITRASRIRDLVPCIDF